MIKGIFKSGLICAGIFGLCVAAVFFGGGVGPCGGSNASMFGLIVGLFTGPTAAVCLLLSSPVLIYRHFQAERCAG
jgi:hypothetical protein